jgi:cytoskeletal protein RodZ
LYNSKNLKRWGSTLSNDHLEHLSQKPKDLEGEGFLPPRHTKHGKRKDEETDYEMEREKSFPLIQIVLYTFLAIIAAFLIFWFWQENQTAPSSTTTKDSQEEVVQKDEDDSASDTGGVKDNDSKGTDSDLSDQGERDEEDGSKGGVGEGSGDGTEQDPQTKADESSDNQNQSDHDTESDQNPQKPEQSQESPGSQEPTNEPKIIAEHIVQPGETLYSITMKYYHSKKYMDYLAEYNRIKDTRNVEAGVKLMIPEKP